MQSSKTSADQATRVDPAAVKTPSEWAAETGHARLARGTDGLVHGAPDAEHLAAQGLHGWKLHEHHENGAMLLAREDYLAAVEAAKELVVCVDKRSHYVPHAKALSRHAPVAADLPVPVKRDEPARTLVRMVGRTTKTEE